MSRCAAVFAFNAHGLARELHQNNALKPKALQLSQRAYQQPIASEPVRRFGHGHAPGAAPMRSLSLAEIAELCDPGFNPLPILLRPAQILSNAWGPPTAIELVQQRAAGRGLELHTKVADLTTRDFVMLPDTFDLIVIAYYLQRDLFAKAKTAVRPGGVVVAIEHTPERGERWSAKAGAAW